MRYKLLGCKILEREIASVIYSCRNSIDVTLIQQKYHNRPEYLKKVLQEEINMIDENHHRYSNNTDENDFDAILLGYGLCSNIVAGLSSRRYPLVIPKAHDCITLLMGDKDRYMEYYKKHPGTYYSSPGFSELIHVDDTDALRRRYEMYLIRYHGNEKHARRAVEIEAEFTQSYQRISYIKWPGLDLPEYEEKARKKAEEKNWSFELIQGDHSILKQMVDGDWPEDRFLVVRPGHHAEPSYDEEILEEK